MRWWGKKIDVIDPQSPPLTIGGTVLNEPDDLVILRGIYFDSKMTFEKLFRSISRVAS